MRKCLRKTTGVFCTIVLASTCVLGPGFAVSSEIAVIDSAVRHPLVADGAQQIAQYYPDNPYGQQSYGEQSYGEQSYMGQSPYQAPGSPYGSYGGAPYQRPNRGPFIYPSRGQSPQQEETDKSQCYSWGVQQSGFDPANPPPPSGPPPQAGPPEGGLLRGGMGGAALGAIGGAIGGNAGKGAAMGAAMGGLFGGMRRRRWIQQSAYQQMGYQQQQQNTLNQGRADYNRAFDACMTGRGYTVE